jgi:aryl-alcohol dehydrogenase-like predicted oxidoreductase
VTEVESSGVPRVDPVILGALQAAVHRSRLNLVTARRGISNTRQIQVAQVALLAALERLEDALSSAGITSPHQLRHEVDLLRCLVGNENRSPHHTW